MKVCFLILHYNEIELTKKAVKSILDMNSICMGDREIVIVDNCSPNNTGVEIVNTYGAQAGNDKEPKDYRVVLSGDDSSKVNLHIILNTENGGFSKGNNVGYTYIKNHIDCDFIVALNNDITFPQKDFVKILYEVYEKEENGFYLAGPDVYTPHIRSHISPLSKKVRDKEDTIAKIATLDELISSYESGFTPAMYFRYIQEKYQDTAILKFYNKIRSNSQYSGATPFDKVAYGCVLNGACIIVDRRYIEENDVLFEEKTFLYAEEDFITLRLIKQGKTIRYCPELVADHVGQGSAGFNRVTYRQFNQKNADNHRKIKKAFETYLKEFE